MVRNTASQDMSSFQRTYGWSKKRGCVIMFHGGTDKGIFKIYQKYENENNTTLQINIY
jgi:hypothetical protein